MRNRVAFALSGVVAGVLSALVGVAAGHLVAALTRPDSSPVIAVGSTVIDLTPTPMKEWAIRHFGTNDKTVLVGSVLVGVLLLAAVAGLLARRRFAYGAGLLLLLVLIPAGAALSRPGASAVDVLPSLAAAAAGLAALAWLTRAMAPAGDPGASPGAEPGERPSAEARRSSRRAVLVGAGAVVAAAAVMGGTGRWITSYRTRAASVDLPVAADPAPALPRGLEDRVP